MKLDLEAVEVHAKHVSAQSKTGISWRVSVGPSGLVMLIFEDDYGRALDTAGVETFAMIPHPSGHAFQRTLLM